MGKAWDCLLIAALATSIGAVGRAEPATDTRLVAVLPLNAPKLDADLRATLEESVRTVAGDRLRARGYRVLTGDTTLQYIEDNGLSAKEVCEASCALRAARELKASLFISGSAVKVEGEYVAFVRLYDTRTEQQLGSVKLEGETIKALRAQFEERADADLFQNVGATGGPAAAAVLPPLSADKPETPPAGWVDPSTHLAWQRDPRAAPRSWEEAAKYCAAFGWRLPTLDEMKAAAQPALADAPGWYWTASRHDPGGAWMFNTREGIATFDFATYRHAARCVH